ncbi:uncharacterized protein LOC143041377 [Oratosquilla oratoria]|uniref:uncharacterized protein LOC143041377 n=1 Tax=Oratosquilla oratoria TaxID=337810 RepID=UPI003F76798E
MVETGGLRSPGCSPVSSPLTRHPSIALPALSMPEPLTPSAPLPCLTPLHSYPYPYLQHLSQYVGVTADPIKQYLQSADQFKHYLASADHFKYLVPEHLRPYVGSEQLKVYSGVGADSLRQHLPTTQDHLKSYLAASEHLKSLASSEARQAEAVITSSCGSSSGVGGNGGTTSSSSGGGGGVSASRAASVFSIESLLAPRASAGVPRLPAPLPSIHRGHLDLLGKNHTPEPATTSSMFTNTSHMKSRGNDVHTMSMSINQTQLLGVVISSSM